MLFLFRSNVVPIPFKFRSNFVPERNWNEIGTRLERSWNEVGTKMARKWNENKRKLERNWNEIGTKIAIFVPISLQFRAIFVHSRKNIIKCVLVVPKSIIMVPFGLFSTQKSLSQQAFVSKTSLLIDFWRFSEKLKTCRKIWINSFFRIAQKTFWTGQMFEISMFAFCYVKIHD